MLYFIVGNNMNMIHHSKYQLIYLCNTVCNWHLSYWVSTYFCNLWMVPYDIYTSFNVFSTCRFQYWRKKVFCC